MPSKKRTLADFVHEKRVIERRNTCPVCKLPKAVRDEIASCRTLKVPQGWILEWLRTEIGVEVTGPQLRVHRVAYHDGRNETA